MTSELAGCKKVRERSHFNSSKEEWEEIEWKKGLHFVYFVYIQKAYVWGSSNSTWSSFWGARILEKRCGCCKVGDTRHCSLSHGCTDGPNAISYSPLCAFPLKHPLSLKQHSLREELLQIRMRLRLIVSSFQSTYNYFFLFIQKADTSALRHR